MSSELTRAAKEQLYRQLTGTVPGVECKGDTIPYTSLNGHMFSYLAKDDKLALRLPKEDRETFLARYNTVLMEQYGIVQKEYVVVPDALLSHITEATPYFEAAYRYVAAMKPKPTTKGKKK